MKFPPKPKSAYILDNAQDRRIFNNLSVISKKKLTNEKQLLLKLLYSQLEKDWRTPLERFIDQMLKTRR
jgi:hypothetical protein